MKTAELKSNKRFGAHLEVNLLGKTKVCSFNCGYCNLGPTVVKLKDLKEASQFPQFEDILYEIKEVVRTGEHPLNFVVISGNGEPTLFPNLLEFTKELKDLLENFAPKTKTALVTNGAHFEQKKNLEAAKFYDDVIIKIDVGIESEFKIANNPLVRGGIDRIISNSRKVKDPILQTMLFKLEGEVFAKSRFDDYCETVGMLSPRSIHLQTITLPPSESRFTALTEDELEVFASLLRRRFSLDIQVFYE